MNTMTTTNSAVSKDGARPEATLLPPVDVIEESSGITLTADLPGVPKDKLRVQVEGDTLTIEGDVALDVPEGMQATHAEVSLAHYRRVFSLSKELDSAKVQAEFANGVLRLRVPKAEHAQPRRIEVKLA